MSGKPSELLAFGTVVLGSTLHVRHDAGSLTKKIDQLSILVACNVKRLAVRTQQRVRRATKCRYHF